MRVEEEIPVPKSKPKVKRSISRPPLQFAYLGLVLFMIVYYARPEDWIPGLSGIPLAKITGILVLVALFFSFSSIRWDLPAEVFFLAVLILHLWLSAVFSPVWRGGAVSVMLDFSKVLPLVIIIYGTVRSMKRLRWILLVQGGSVASIAIASIAGGHLLGGRLQGVLSGIYGNPNDLALIIDFGLPLCLALALTNRGWWKKLAWSVVILVMIYAVFLTASRAGAMALSMAALVCLWQLGIKGRRFYLLLLLPVAILGTLLYSGNALRQRFGQTAVDQTSSKGRTEASESALQREELLFKSLRITAEHPLFGIGPGDFEIVSGVWHVTHNSYTQISAEGGLPAFVLYTLILWRGISNLRDIRKYRKTARAFLLYSIALEASLAAYLVGSFFASLAYHLFPYCLIAYTSALRRVVQQDVIAYRRASDTDAMSGPVEVTA